MKEKVQFGAVTLRVYGEKQVEILDFDDKLMRNLQFQKYIFG